MHTRVLFVLTAAVALAPAVAAQAQLAYHPYLKRHLPARVDASTAVATGDVDGDGDTDIVFGNRGQTVLLLANGTSARYDDATAQLPARSMETTAVVLVDVDQDTDLDLVLANRVGVDVLWLNDGAGNFASAPPGRLPGAFTAAEAIAAGDVDGDGDPDLVVASAQAVQTRLYLNDGSGTFTDVTAGNLPIDSDDSYGVALGDFDGDGDPDIALANGGTFAQQARVYRNDGKGKFTDDTATVLPVDPGQGRDVVFADVDGDLDLDLVMVRGDGGQPGPVHRVYVNSGGVYQDHSQSWLPNAVVPASAVAAADLDGDGDQDLVLCDAAGGCRSLRNDANSKFVAGDAFPGGSAVRAVDLDGDGDRDLVFAAELTANRVFLAVPGGYRDLSAVQTPGYAYRGAGIAAADVDGDGDLDLMVGNRSAQSPLDPQPNVLLRNDGRGAFTDVTAASFATVDRSDTRVIVFGDVDRDGDLDLIEGNHHQQSRLYLNDGKGSFTDVTAARMPPDVDTTHAVEIADFDGDLDLDLVFGNDGGVQNRLYLNDGTGRFTDVTATHLPADAANTWSMDVGDVDRDGDLDIVLGNILQSYLYLNDGSARFSNATATHLPKDSRSCSGIALGDVDGDGDLDIVFANSGAFPLFDPQNRLYLNDGTGHFADATAGRMPVRTSDSTSVALADFDEDGDLDVVFGNGRTLAIGNWFYANDGTGTFTDVTASRLESPVTATNYLAVGDLDGDRDLDVAFANWGQDPVILTNLHRQLLTPYQPVPGQPYEFEYTSAPGYGTDSFAVTTVFHFVLAASPLKILDWGTLYIEPSFLVALPSIPVSGGSNSLVVQVPNDATMVGLLFASQGFMLPAGAGKPALTNYMADIVQR